MENFKFTPERDMKDNNPWTGYGKLYMNGKFITRVYNKRLFLKSLPVGNNEIKVMDGFELVDWIYSKQEYLTPETRQALGISAVPTLLN